MANFSPIFIVGTGRCGSTLMTEIIAKHPKILSLSEVFTSFTTKALYEQEMDSAAFIDMLANPALSIRKAITADLAPREFTYKFGPTSAYTKDNLPTCLMMTLPRFSDEPDQLYERMIKELESWPTQQLSGWYTAWFGWLAQQHDKDLWIERTGSSITMVKPLLRMFPDAKFVHIYRDGRETALSIQKFKPMRVFLHLRNRLRYIGIDILKSPFRQSDSWLIHLTAPIMERVLPIDSYLEMAPTLEQSGTFWSDMLKTGMKDLESVRDSHLHNICYADLVSRPRETLSTFLDFAAPGLPQDDWLDDVSSIPKKLEPAWKQLSAEEQKILEEACSPGMALLGLDYHQV